MELCSGRELAGTAAGSGGPSVGLGDVQPTIGIRADGDESEVVAVAAPGHQQTEVRGRPGDPLFRIRRTELPDRARRCDQLVAELDVRRGQTARLVAEVPRQRRE